MPARAVGYGAASLSPFCNLGAFIGHNAQIRSWLSRSRVLLERATTPPHCAHNRTPNAPLCPPVAPPGAMSQTPSGKRICRREPAPAPLAGAAPAPARPPARVPVFKKFPPPTLPPPPLLDLLERFPDLFALELLAWLPPAARASLARAGRVWRDAVFPRDIFPKGLSRARKSGRGAVRIFKLRKFLVSSERLAWANANGCPWGTRTTSLAARGGHLEVLKWLRELDCPWVESTCAAAAEGGHLEVLEWAREHGCPWMDDLEDGHLDCCALAAQGGYMEVLKWLREHHCPWDELTCAWAAYGGQLEVLKWAREHGCPWQENINDDPDLDCCALAAEGGHLEVLKWLREHHCPCDADTCASAALGGHLEVLKWLRAQACPWDERTCALAAYGGHLEVLKWAREQGCPWDAETRQRAEQARIPGAVAVGGGARCSLRRADTAPVASDPRSPALCFGRKMIFDIDTHHLSRSSSIA